VRNALDFADQNGFADTPTVISSKGLHLYYQYPKDKEVVRNFQGVMIYQGSI
jgi:hypothetical protein